MGKIPESFLLLKQYSLGNILEIYFQRLDGKNFVAPESVLHQLELDLIEAYLKSKFHQDEIWQKLFKLVA